MEKSKLLNKVSEDIVLCEDGYYRYWPTINKGAYSAETLFWIAEDLVKRNLAWDYIIQKNDPLINGGPDVNT